MPRQLLDPTYREEIRNAYLRTEDKDKRAQIIERACKESGYTYGGLMRALDMNLRNRSLSKKESELIEYMNGLGKLVWEYQTSQSSNTRSIQTTVAIRSLKDQKLLPESVTYFQISKAIRRQQLKNKAGSYFTRFEQEKPLTMMQLDFTRSVYLEHIIKDGSSFLKLSKSKTGSTKQERVWIAVAIDDCSRVTYARYYLANGESSRLAQTFLLRTCRQKAKLDKEAGELIPIPLLQGQPKILYTDRGSAFRNAMFANGVRKLGIKHIIGSSSTDTQGKKLNTSNKQGRGKVERMIKYIKDDFETSLYLDYPLGTTFTLKEINRLFQKWLVTVNTSAHPTKRISRWEVFKAILDEGIEYPPEEAELLFSNSVFRKVTRRQVRITNTVYCKVPAEIDAGETIEIITIGGDHYIMVDGRRVRLQLIQPKNANQQNRTKPKESVHDTYIGLALRRRLNREIEERTKGHQNLGMLSEQYPKEIMEFTSDRKSTNEIKQFTTQLLLLNSRLIGKLSIDSRGKISKEVKTKKSI